MKKNSDTNAETKEDRGLDQIDRVLLAALQADASRPYAELGQAAGLSAGAAHERIKKLRARGVIRRNTVEIDPAAIGKDILSFVTIDASAWMGDEQTAAALRDITEIEAAYIVAGSGSVLLKVRTASTNALQSVLRRLFDIEGVRSTQATVTLETLFERPVAVDSA